MATSWVMKVTDHSYWNTIKSWQALYDYGVRAVVLRASSGGTYVDPKFAPYYTDAKSIGLKVLAYHVSNPLFTASTNIACFQKAITGYKLDGLPVLDCQSTGGQSNLVIRDRNKSMFYLLKSYYGGAINYTAKWFWEQYMGTGNTWVKEFPLWVANYWLSLAGELWPSDASYTTVIPTDYLGEERFMWQFSEKGLLPLASVGNMDKSAAYPKFEKALFSPVPTPPTSDCLQMKVLSAMNIRSGPGTTYSVVGSAIAGTVYEVKGVDGSDCWIEIDSCKWIAVKTGGKVYMEKI
jgi:GH25 family lysozyme M1 (1,4-beta-N-acetylmuramidase)